MSFINKNEPESIKPSKSNNQTTIKKTNENTEIKNLTFKVGEDVTKKINDILLTEEKIDLAKTIEKKELNEYKEIV